MALSAVLVGSLVAGCGSGDEAADVATAPERAVGASPSATASVAASPSASAAAVDLAPFTDSKSELEGLFERLRAAKAFHTVLVPRGGGFGPKYREVLDLRFGPLTWRERVYDPDLTREQIRVGDDLFERRVADECKRQGMSDWFVTKGGGDVGVKSEPTLAPGALPFWTLDLDGTRFTSRQANGSGWTMRGKTAVGLSATKSPVEATLDRAGLPIKITMGEKTGDDSVAHYVVTFSYDDVVPIPTVSKAKTSTAGIPDFCEEGEAPMPESDSDVAPAPAAPAPAPAPAKP